jgi:polyhydroxyalkanoate synthesis regulator phasin
MTTYSTMRTRIADEMVNDGDITSAQINYAIQDAIKQYERRPWWWNQKTDTMSTVASQEYYSSSDLADIPDIVQIVAATVTSGNLKSPLRAVDYLTIDDEQDGSVEGEPRCFAVFKEQIRLYPIPEAVYTVTLSYIYRLTALSADGDSNAWTTDAEELIRQGAKRRIALNYLQADDLAGRFAVMEREAFTELQAENRRRWPNTVLRTPAMLPHKMFDITRGY